MGVSCARPTPCKEAPSLALTGPSAGGQRTQQRGRRCTDADSYPRPSSAAPWIWGQSRNGVGYNLPRTQHKVLVALDGLPLEVTLGRRLTVLPRCCAVAGRDRSCCCAGTHAWVFFTSPVPAEMARRLGTGLLREAMAMRGRMKLDSYDRLFPSQDLLPAGGIGNLIAAPLFRPARRNGATVFLNLEDLEPHKDQWRYLSTLGRMTPQEVKRAADRAGRVAVAGDVTRLAVPFSSQIRTPAAPVLHVRLGAGIRAGQAEVTPALAAARQARRPDRHARTGSSRPDSASTRQTRGPCAPNSAT